MPGNFNCEILKDNYIMFRKYQSHNRAGDVLIAIKNAAFKSIRKIPLPEQLQELEVVAASVTTSQDRERFLFCSFYRRIWICVGLIYSIIFCTGFVRTLTIW